MNSRRITIFFATFSLIFVISNFVEAQTANDSSIYELPAGTIFHVQMDNGISSKISNVNDTFTATIFKPVIVREIVVIPIGAVIEGRVDKVKRAAIGNKNGSMEVSFFNLKFESGDKREIRGSLGYDLTSESGHLVSAIAVVGGTAVGGMLGSVSDVDNGALIGLGIGAGAGAAIAFLRKGKEVELATDQKFEIKLTKEVTLPVRDF